MFDFDLEVTLILSSNTTESIIGDKIKMKKEWS